MPITLYDLSGLNGRRFSPFGWRARMALAHKGLEADAAVELIRFSDKDKLGFSGQKLVPVLVDGETVVHDSWEIARHLETSYPNAPSLFGGEAGEAGARLVAAYVDSQLHSLVARCVVADIPNVLHEDDLPYFRESREKRFGMPLEQIVANREETRDQMKTTLYPVRVTLNRWDFLGGSTPSFADFAVFGAFMWARGVSDFKMLDTDDPVHTWRERMLDLYDGMPRGEAGFPV
jgi:glutathione S-transferase